MERKFSGVAMLLSTVNFYVSDTIEDESYGDKWQAMYRTHFWEHEANYVAIKKSEENPFYYRLILKDESLCYSTKQLIFNNEISINNFTIFDLNIPDFDENNNHYKIISVFDNQEIEIKNKRNIYKFKFKNEQFNEIIPHNLYNKANIFINHTDKKRCCIDYSYLNWKKEIPKSITITVNNKQYNINHSNCFDSHHRIGFILINIPSNQETEKIRAKTKREIISSKIWLTESLSNNDEYKINQVLDVDEANPKIYSKYDFIPKVCSNFENLYSDFLTCLEIGEIIKLKF